MEAMKAINIIWDVDPDDIDLDELPSEIVLPDGMEDEKEISDYISDITGFCHKGFELMKIPSIAYRAYELYKIDWMRRISADRQMQAMREYFECKPDNDDYSFDDYIRDYGYGGELYVCFEEFYCGEYFDKEYMRNILLDGKMFAEYKDHHKKLCALKEQDLRLRIREILSNAVGSNYADNILSASLHSAKSSLLVAIIQDITDCSARHSKESYNDDDIRSAIGRTLLRAIGKWV